VNPKRAFNLVINTLFRHYRKRLTLWDFMGAVYSTLGVGEGEPKGLFQSFDPSRYHGKSPLEQHFLNLFKKKLWGRLVRLLRTPTHKCKARDRLTFLARPALGLVREEKRVSRQEHDLVQSISEALACLDGPEKLVIQMVYWDSLSARKVATILQVDHKTVGRRHNLAIRKLRQFYDVAA